MSSKPRVIWLYSHFMYWMGGTKFIYEVIKRISKKYDILVIVENSSKQAIENYKKIGVKVLSLNKLTSTSLVYWLFFPIQIIEDYWLINKILKSSKMKVDNTILVTIMFPMNFIAMILGFRHVQYCFEPFAFFHDKEFIKDFNPIKKFLINVLSILYKWIDILATKRADNVITLNQTTFKTMKMVYGVNSRISFAGIDTKHFYPHVSKEIKDTYDEKLLIIHSTDYSPVKGTDKMIRIFSQVKKEVPSSHLLITSTIVNNSELTRLKKLAKSLMVDDSIEFLGFVDYDILPQLYSLSRVLVQCSYSTLSGTTSMALPVKEAMACGTPAIRYPILDEDVVDGVTGFLVDPRKTNLMVKRIVEILKMDDKVYNQFSRKARISIANRYNWDSTSDIILNEIKAVKQK